MFGWFKVSNECIEHANGLFRNSLNSKKRSSLAENYRVLERATRPPTSSNANSYFSKWPKPKPDALPATSWALGPRRPARQRTQDPMDIATSAGPPISGWNVEGSHKLEVLFCGRFAK